MSVIDNRTVNRNYLLPNGGNEFPDDLLRLIAALTAIDADVASLVDRFAEAISLDSPLFTGNPRGPTRTAGDNSTSLATTAFIATALVNLLNSPNFTGDPTAPTQPLGDNSLRIANTAHVTNAINTLVNNALGGDTNFAATTTAELAGKLNVSDLTSAPAKSVLSDADTGLLGDSASSGAVKKFSFSSLWSYVATKLGLINGGGFRAGFTFLGTQNRSLVLPNKDMSLDSGWEVIEDVTLAGIASYTKTGLGAFRELRIEGGVIPSAGGSIAMLTSSDNGATFPTQTSKSLTIQNNNGTISIGATAYNNWAMMGFTAIAGTYQVAFDFIMTGFNTIGSRWMKGTAEGVSSATAAEISGYLTTHANVTAASNAIRILVGAGTMTGSFTLYGKRG